MKRKLLLFYFVLINSLLYSQKFETSSLIDIPGSNKNYKIFPIIEHEFTEPSYICWENHLDSVYNIYLQKISPDISDSIFTVYSSLNESCNPTMAYGTDNSIFIVWQTKINNKWQLFGRTFKKRYLTEIQQITNTGYDNITPSLSNSRLVWNSEGKILLKLTENLNDDPYILDENYCFNPKIIKNDGNDYTEILYEKGKSFDKQIYHAILKRKYPENKLVWEKNKISKYTYNEKPRFCTEGNIAFQTRVNDIWKTCYFLWDDTLSVSKNKTYNKENPFIFTYPMPTASSNNNETPFYIAFDSDSLLDNKEIYISPLAFAEIDSVINISSMEGEDCYPAISIVTQKNEFFLAVIWEHKEDNDTSIWWALTKFNPIIGNIEKSEYLEKFYILQNYPNPFNPTTIIKYSFPVMATHELPQRQRVLLKVYDILGKEVTTLVNEKQKPGNYQAIFDASNLSSGVYYYQLKVGNFVETKKMMLLR